MISTGEAFLILFLLAILGLGIFAFFIFHRQRKGLLDFRYTRGANASIPPGKDSVDVTMKCDGGKEICVYRATQICTAVGPDGFERSPLDPMSDGTSATGGSAYGDFNPNTTVDLTKKIGMECNGKGECTFKFTKDWSSVNGECMIDGQDATTQLIATYTCYPPGSNEKGECQSWSPKNSSIPTDPPTFPSTPLQRIIYPGCTLCSDNKGRQMLYCPKGVLPKSATRNIAQGVESIISNYRMPAYDPESPDYTYKGQGFWWRQYSKGCPA